MQKISVFLIGFALLAGCTAPKPLSDEELFGSAKVQQERMGERLSALDEPLTLPEALAWALENNIEFRLQAYQAALATGNRKLATLSMLPTLTARAGYRNRSNVQASVSESITTGQVSLAASTSSDEESHTYGLELGWNTLDFGLAWFRAREFGEQGLIAEEERRRVLHQLSLELISAWDQAVAWQKLRPRLENARALLAEALAHSEKILALGLRDQVEVLEYRKALLLILKRVNQLERQMNQARDELARLMGLPGGVPVELSTEDSSWSPPEVLADVGLQELQWLALLHRPEMKQALYRSRSAERSSLRRMLEGFPSLMFSYGTNYDSNSFLIHNRWDDTSASLSMNLIQLASLPARYKMGKLEKIQAAAGVELQATAILSQVAIADKAWRSARLESCLSDRLEKVDSQKLGMLRARASAAALDRLTVVRAEVDNLLIEIEAALHRAELRRATLVLASSVGASAVPEFFTSEQTEGKAAEIETWLSEGLNAFLTELLAQSAEGDALPRPPVQQFSVLAEEGPCSDLP